MRSVRVYERPYEINPAFVEAVSWNKWMISKSHLIIFSRMSQQLVDNTTAAPTKVANLFKRLHNVSVQCV